jgi:hypothetical protein
MQTVDILESFSGPIGNPQVTMTTNTSLSLAWTTPESPKGVISGFSIYVNNTAVSIKSQSTLLRVTVLAYIL